nr:hypothetical protein [Nostoc sp. ChiSLP03a]MDZ8211055.1 hypothetical protein [Nostoc sp. ChiSLP03a]
MMFSGIGNAEHLRSLDILVVWRRCRAACGQTSLCLNLSVLQQF